jgi:hypothetical protein
MIDSHAPYRVYHLNRYVKTFQTRDAAADWVWSQRVPEDYEILDKSDE